VTLVFDLGGNRMQETIAEVTTGYLVADQNLTGLRTANVEKRPDAL
jgi:hypothetical protein